MRLTKDSSKAQRSMKSIESKCARLEKLVKRKEMELERVQANYQEKEMNEARYSGNASQMFEKIFGKAARPQDHKFLRMLSSYDMMIEKVTKERNTLDKHCKEMKQHIQEMEDKLYMLSNGKELPSYPGNKPTQEFIEKLQRMEQQECRLKSELLMLKEENVSLMSQVETEAGEKRSLIEKLNAIHGELQQRVTIQESYGLKAELKDTRIKLRESEALNASLEADIMSLKNETVRELSHRIRILRSEEAARGEDPQEEPLHFPHAPIEARTQIPTTSSSHLAKRVRFRVFQTKSYALL